MELRIEKGKRGILLRLAKSDKSILVLMKHITFLCVVLEMQPWGVYYSAIDLVIFITELPMSAGTSEASDSSELLGLQVCFTTLDLENNIS